MTAQVRTATQADSEGIIALLQANELPTSDLAECRPEFVVVEDSGELIGTGGVQVFGDAALVRSVAIAKDRQKTGLGTSLLGELERHASAQGVRELVLLTQTAEPFFARHGYSRVERVSVPQPIQATAEFRSLCPASAVCMVKRLTSSRRSNAQLPDVTCARSQDDWYAESIAHYGSSLARLARGYEAQPDRREPI
jgi:amino-acid N-acetyltransferase